jgi:hypothetical protein
VKKKAMLANPRRRKLGQALASLVAASLLATSGCAKLYHAIHYNCVAEALTDHHRLYYHSPSTGRIIVKKRAEDCRVELPCYGYSSTCWRQWPEGCEKCPVESSEPAPIVNAVPAESVVPGTVVEPTPAAAPAEESLDQEANEAAAAAEDTSEAVKEEEANLQDLGAEEPSDAAETRADESNSPDSEAPEAETPAADDEIVPDDAAEVTPEKAEVPEPELPAETKDANPLDDSDVLGVPPIEDSGAVERPFEKSPAVPMTAVQEIPGDASMAEAAEMTAPTATSAPQGNATLPRTGLGTGEAAGEASKELLWGSSDRPRYKIAVTAPPQQAPADIVPANGSGGLVVLPASAIDTADLVRAVSKSKPIAVAQPLAAQSSEAQPAGVAPIRVQAEGPASMRFVTEKAGTADAAPVVRRADATSLRFR